MDIKYSYYNTSKGYRVVGGTAAHFLKADGSLDGTSYIPVNTEINMGDKNLNFTSGSLSKVENGSRVFNKVFQNYTQSAQTGILSIKFPQASTSATMFDVTIKIFNFQTSYLGTIRVSFYKQTAILISTTGRKCLIECTDNFPSTIVNVGLDLAGNICINLGDVNTAWSLYTTVEVERVSASHSGNNIDWSKGWSQTVETVAPVVPTTHQSLVSIPTEIGATRSWINSGLANVITTNTTQTGLTGDKTTSGTWNFNGSTATGINLLRPANTINNSIGIGFDNVSTYFGLADSNTFAVGTSANLASVSSRSLWIDNTLSTLNLRGQIGGSTLAAKDLGGFTINTTTNNSRAEMILRHVWSSKNQTFGIGGVSSPTSGSMSQWGLTKWLNDRTVNGNDGFFGWVGDTDILKATSLAGTGTRMVTADVNGVLGTQAVPSAQNLSINPTIAGTIDISGGGTSANLQSLLPISKSDANIRSMRTEMQPYYTSNGSVNYPSQIGAGIRLERYSSASDQRGFNLWSAGVSGQIYFKTFNGSVNESTWEVFASREWANSQFSLLNHTHTFESLTSKPTTLSGYGITDAMSTSHPANGITSTNISNWNASFGWGDYRQFGLGSSLVSNTLVDFNEFNTELGLNSRLFSTTGATPLNGPVGQQYPSGILITRSSAVQSMLVFGGHGNTNTLAYRNKTGTNTWGDWIYAWTTKHFSQTDLDKFKTAFPTNFANTINSTVFTGDLLAMPVGTYSATVGSTATNVPFSASIAGGLISVGQSTVSTRILGARDNSDNLWFQSGDGTGAWRQLASREWSTANLALTNHTHTFASLTAKPTTAAGYGITDVPRQGVFGGDINSIRSNDTRNTNPLPSTDLKSGVWFDFKNSAAIGLTAPNTSTYSASMTFVPYADDSGNSVVAFRLSHSNNRLFYQSYNAGAWNNGKYLWTSSDFSQTEINNWNTAFNWGNHANAGYLTNSALYNYYTKNESLNLFVKNSGVETISDTKTFTHSPVIPAGTLGTHAVNVNQLSTKANGQENATAVGFSSGNIPTADGNSFPYMYHNSGLYVALATQSYLQTNFLSTPDGTSVIISGSNLNNYLKTGFYRGSGLTNAPLNNSGWWYVVIETHDSTWVTQKAISFGSGNTPNVTYQRSMTGGSWSAWAQIWTTQDFTVSNIQQWNYMAQYGLQVNSDFTVNTGSGLVIADDYFGGESGIVDNQEGRLLAAKSKEYYFYGSKYDQFDGLNFNWERKLFGMGREANKDDKLTVEGSVKASKNFKSEDERPDTIFIPNGKLATLRDEIVNDESDYAIRLDPHEYEIDPSGYLEVDDRNRLIHVIGEQIKMVVNFREIYPKQQIVIYNFDKYGGTMAVQVHGKTIYNIDSGCFLRLYVTKSLKVIAERQQPSEFVL